MPWEYVRKWRPAEVLVRFPKTKTRPAFAVYRMYKDDDFDDPLTWWVTTVPGYAAADATDEQQARVYDTRRLVRAIKTLTRRELNRFHNGDPAAVLKVVHAAVAAGDILPPLPDLTPDPE